jgi:hypothetical protein
VVFWFLDPFKSKSTKDEFARLINHQSLNPSIHQSINPSIHHQSAISNNRQSSRTHLLLRPALQHGQRNSWMSSSSTNVPNSHSKRTKPGSPKNRDAKDVTSSFATTKT